MPVNRNALIRYRTIDACLQKIDTGVSRRTVQDDMELMYGNKQGYEAPIVVVDKKYNKSRMKRSYNC